jgi:hypothetical protein
MPRIFDNIDKELRSGSKRNIDEIDTVLAKHYGFTAEESDFIINYDIKYRLGRDSESVEEYNTQKEFYE